MGRAFDKSYDGISIFEVRALIAALVGPQRTAFATYLQKSFAQNVTQRAFINQQEFPIYVEVRGVNVPNGTVMSVGPSQSLDSASNLIVDPFVDTESFTQVLYPTECLYLRFSLASSVLLVEVMP